MSKKFLSMILTLFMVLSLVPNYPVYAETNTEISETIDEENSDTEIITVSEEPIINEEEIIIEEFIPEKPQKIQRQKMFLTQRPMIKVYFFSGSTYS